MSSQTTRLAPQIVQLLQQITEAPVVLADDPRLGVYGIDRTTAYACAPAAIVFPRSVQQVQDVIKMANKHAIAIVPSGGRTGLSGGAVAANGELVVSMEKMHRLYDFNSTDRTVVCEAGVITRVLQEFAEQQGLYYPVDFASSGSSQIGGNIATNAGGINVIRYGMTREWVAGLKVVTGKGELLELNRGLRKNNAGYDLRQLFIGSEGTLGVIVEATMRLIPAPVQRSVLLLGVPQFDAIMSILEKFQSAVSLSAFEFFSENALIKLLETSDLTRPMAQVSPYYALLEFDDPVSADGAPGMQNTVMALFQECLDHGWISDGVISQSEKQKQMLWRFREDISQTLSRWSPYKNDISTVVSKVPAFIRDVEAVVSGFSSEFEVVWYGHIGDGNVHLNILKPDAMPSDAFHRQCQQLSERVFAVVARYGGSISAEHGVGLLKKAQLPASLGSEQLDYMRGIKALFDPKAIMNPGKLL